MNRSLTSLLIVAAVLGLAVAPAVVAQIPLPDIGGTWQITATVYIPDIVDPCVYQGNVPLTEDGGTFSGPADLLLLSGPDSCPGELTGTLTGMLSASTTSVVPEIRGTISGSDPSGEAIFGGNFGVGPVAMSTSPGARPTERDRLATKSLQAGGGLSVTQGDFAGASGGWSAARLAFALNIPGLTPVGLTLMVVLLLGAGAFVLRGQHGSA
jgi:hypothetical protein